MASEIPEQKKKSSKPREPKTIDLIKKAIVDLKEPRGSSVAAIKKQLTAMGVDVQKKNTIINKALKKGVSDGVLKQTKGTGANGTFKLDTTKALAAEKAKEKKVKTAELKKAAKEKAKEKKAETKAKMAAKKAAAKKKSAAKKKKTTAKPKKALKKPAKSCQEKAIVKKPAKTLAAKKPAKKEKAPLMDPHRDPCEQARTVVTWHLGLYRYTRTSVKVLDYNTGYPTHITKSRRGPEQKIGSHCRFYEIPYRKLPLVEKTVKLRLSDISKQEWSTEVHDNSQ
ncbi:Histone H1.5 [Holothuria leucospilota]|uniref:Histone H1.5 n=1 Tax=Holothuria leucospilota TaxID=206669 RepID=A0A9Q1H906_HOLLE|nr:Histone H1.5 [Holothuria leucospilota]